MAKSTTGLDSNVASLLCYALGWVSGLVFYLIEKDDAEVRFHAAQSIVVFGSLTVIATFVGAVPILGGVMGSLVNIVSIVAWIVLMVFAYQGKHFSVPICGDFAKKML